MHFEVELEALQEQLRVLVGEIGREIRACLAEAGGVGYSRAASLVAELLELATIKLDLTSPARCIFSEQGDEYDADSMDLIGMDEVLYVSCGENFAPPVALAAPHTSLAAATLAPGPAASVNLGEAGGTCPTKTTRVTTRVTN